LTVGFFSPLPPIKSGVAEYAAALLSALPGATRVSADGDINLYHLGNNQLHREIFERAMARRGVVVLHDAVMHHFYLGSMTRAEYLNAFTANYGAWHRGMAEELWAQRPRSASDERYFRWPMLKAIASTARAVIVHTEAASQAVLKEAPSAQVEVIPHLPLPASLPDAVEVERWRHARGILPSHTLFGLMGFLRESKRVQIVLRAFQKLAAHRNDIHLLVAGEIGSSDLARAIAPLLVHARIHRVEHAPEPQLQLLASACDVGVNLRYPTANESSGMTARWTRLSRPVLLTESEDIPEAACPRVPAGPAEQETLEAFMLWLADSPVRRRECGRLAAEWAANQPSLEAIAQRYWRVLELCRS